MRRAPLFQGIIDDEDLIRSTASRSLYLSSFLPHPLSLPSSPCRALFDSVFVCRCLKLIACVFVCVGLLTHASAWDRCELARYEEGEVIISQGQSHDDDSMYIIESGSVSVRERAVHCDTGIDMVRTHALASSSRPSLCCCLSLPPSSSSILLLFFHCFLFTLTVSHVKYPSASSGKDTHAHSRVQKTTGPDRISASWRRRHIR